MSTYNATLAKKISPARGATSYKQEKTSNLQFFKILTPQRLHHFFVTPDTA